MWEWIVAHQQIVILGALIVYAILPANSPIKLFLQKFIGGIVGPQPVPGPNPNPNPTPSPLPTDLSGIIQMLVSLLMNAKATGNKELEDATTKVIASVQAEQTKIMMSSPLFSATKQQ